MKRAFRAVLLAGAAIIGLSSSAQAFLVQAPYITETQFDYTVHNVSSDLYVWGFIISHQPGDAAFTTQPNWSRVDIAGSCLGSDTQCFFFHSNTDISDPTFDIGPGTTSSLFFHGQFASDYVIMTTDSTGQNEFDFSGSTSTTPLPAALPLMGSVLGGGYWLARRRKSRQAEASKTA